jgi:polyhydroxybutyrate depolymerase
MRSSLLIAAVAVLFSVDAMAQAQRSSAATLACSLSHTSGVHERQLTTGGRQRSYRLFVPAQYDGRTALPLVLELHGSGGTAEQQARTSGFETVAARDGFAVASLQADGGRWNVPVREGRADDVAYVEAVIDDASLQLCVDATRIYATGFSGGARMSSLLGCKLNHRIAAIAPVSGLRWPAPCNGRAIPVLTFHGLADTQNPYAGHVEGRDGEWIESVPDALAGWAAHNGCKPALISEQPPGPLSTMRYGGCRDGAEVRLIRIDALGHTWTRKEVDTTEVMWQFFKSHRLQ